MGSRQPPRRLRNNSLRHCDRPRVGCTALRSQFGFPPILACTIPLRSPRRCFDGGPHGGPERSGRPTHREHRSSRHFYVHREPEAQGFLGFPRDDDCQSVDHARAQFTNQPTGVLFPPVGQGVLISSFSAGVSRVILAPLVVRVSEPPPLIPSPTGFLLGLGGQSWLAVGVDRSSREKIESRFPPPGEQRSSRRPPLCRSGPFTGPPMGSAGTPANSVPQCAGGLDDEGVS